MPDHTMSNFLDLSDSITVSHTVGMCSIVMPRRFPSSLDASMSKPTSSFFSLRNSIGGKASSMPMVSFPAFLTRSQESSAANALPVNTNARSVMTKKINRFFFIPGSPS